MLQVPVPRLDLVETARAATPDADLIVVYQFATADQLTALENQQVPTLKWPVSWTEVEHVAIAEYGYNTRPRPATSRRYSDEELIAVAASVDDGTNSPQYLIEAIHQLNALTEYTAETAAVAQNQGPYRQLASDAALARTQLEQALETLLESLT